MRDTRKFLLSAAVVGVCLVSRAEIFLTYESFGAAGDGKTDDRAAIVAAHAAANKAGKPVRAADGKTYYIGGGDESAIVETDVDFGTARFVIDDRAVKKLHSPLFVIRSRQTSFPLKGLVTLKKGQKQLGVKPGMSCLVQLANKNVRRYIRYGLNQNAGHPQQETILVDAEGCVDPAAPILWDYDAVTTANARPIDTHTLIVKGGVFVTIANQEESRYRYHGRGFIIERSNVRLEGMRYEVTGELDHGAPYDGFLSFHNCANGVVTGCVFTAHRMYHTIGSAGRPVGMGSYALTANGCINLSFVDCRQTTDIRDTRYWGLFGSNYCKNLLFDGCEFSRFDAHEGVANATIRNSRLGHMGVSTIGFGLLSVENTTLCSHNFIVLRGDYGSCWDGEIVIRNCRFEPYSVTGSCVPTLVQGTNAGQHDFGYVCRMPRRITVDGLYVDDAKAPKDYAGPQLFSMFNKDRKDASYVEKYPYVLTEEVVLRNVKTASGKPFTRGPNAFMFKDVRITQ